jgi:hypothetical protein
MTTVPAGGDAMALERAETAYDVPCACGCGLRVCVRARAAQPRRSALQRLKADDPTLTALTLARTAVGDDGARWLGAALAAGARGLLRMGLSDCGLTGVVVCARRGAVQPPRAMPVRHLHRGHRRAEGRTRQRGNDLHLLVLNADAVRCRLRAAWRGAAASCDAGACARPCAHA